MKLEAFTIVESMMALIVIMISFTAGMTLYLSILKGDAFPLVLKANNALNTVLIETKQQARFLDEEVYKEGLLIKKEVQPYTSHQQLFAQEGVYQVSLAAFSPNQDLIATQKHLIVWKEE